MNRREFLGLLGKGAVVVGAGGLIVPAAKKIWQVHPNTPLRRGAEVKYMFDTDSGNWYADPPKAYTPRQFEDILQSLIQTARDNYGQPTNAYMNTQELADLKQALECKEPTHSFRTESLALQYHKFQFEPDNIKLWSGNSKA